LLLVCFSSSGRQGTIIRLGERYQSVRTVGDRPPRLAASRGGAISKSNRSSSTERSRPWISSGFATAALPPIDRGEPHRRPFPLRHQAKVEMTTLHDLATPNIESSPHSPSCGCSVTTGGERNQLCSRWRRSTKGEPSYDLGRTATPDTDARLEAIDEKAASLPPASSPTRFRALEIAAVGSCKGT